MVDPRGRPLVMKPMLAASPGPEGIPSSSYPLMATFKVDGIRALVVDGALLSRTLKPIPNVTLRTVLQGALPDGCDGELTRGGTFQSSTSAVMTIDGPADGFRYHVFDFVPSFDAAACAVPYVERMDRLRRVLAEPATKARLAKARATVEVVALYPVSVAGPEELARIEGEALEAGFEGLIVRAPRGRYKFGRATAKEGLMTKVKRFTDAEAVVIGFEELVHQDAPDGKSGAKSGVLGALVVRSADARAVSFKIGTGFDASQREAFWRDRRDLLGLLVKYKSFEQGAKDRPRFPVFLGFRHVDDT